MNNNKNNRNVLIVSSLALFSMFFGAGNMLFPPTLGRWAGSSYPLASLGFLMTSVGIVILALLSTVKTGGTIESNAMPVGRKFATFFGTAIMLAIGPGLAIPRTAATSFEILQVTLFPGLSPVIVSIAFFAVVLFLSINPSDIVSNLGKVLTPVLVITLLLLIVKGIISPIGAPVDTGQIGIFLRSFEEGYQTMDGLAAFAFTNVLILGYIDQGIKSTKDQASLTINAGIIAGIGLSIIYGGLLYIGATTSGLGVDDLGRTELLIYISRHLLGQMGVVVLAISIILACLTTAIGLTASVSTYFERVTKGRIKYRTVAILSTVFSAFFAITGVDRIVALSGPVLGFIYPMAMALILTNLIGLTYNKNAMTGGVIGAIIYSVLDILANMEILDLLSPIKSFTPDILESLLWIPFVIVSVVIFIMTKPIQK